VLDKFIQIIEENDIQPGDLKSVKLHPHPIVQFKVWQKNELRISEDYCFSAHYLISRAIHRIKPAHWHESYVKEDKT
jgi:hypothetical protein